MPEGDVSKLPKWAQQRIDVLEQNIDAWKRRALAGPDDADTFAMHLGEQAPLGSGTTVRFVLGDDPRYGIRGRMEVDCRVDRGELYVYGGSHGLSVLPWSTNVVKIIARGT